ncbi:hypothetical protein CA54_18810 [Symmachiella macrocystis]|uniref:Uncharacterized protein n=1 Tax=Symmachiella macrocystis TaxID=2527985 RepID=A0A5C6BM13_9PLAN|nr:hypothetical protein [Symmachiella macrocystis]TWU13055.1 hypothetical protein CA54_18810 [Symmachiella macrocystis]
MQDRPCVAVAETTSAIQFSPPGKIGLVPARNNWVPQKIESLLKLGAGRAAEAILVKARDQTGHTRLCVEKIFRPGWLTRAVYRCAFQAPFAYQNSEDAILACFYRRRVAARLVEALVPGVRVAEPLYVRWDRSSRAFVLGSELIRGRGIRPAAADLQTLRRTLRNGFGNPYGNNQQPPEEIDDLLRIMRRLEALMHECGLVGSGWQVSQSAVVATANLLRTKSEYVVVDLESGIPALLVPFYLAAGWRMRSMPLFDDLEPRMLRNFVEEHWPKLQSELGRTGFQQLADDVEALIEHTERWKQAEIALGRRSTSLFSRSFRKAQRLRCFDIWQRHEIIDEKTANQFRSSSRLWSRPIFWLGVIPGSPGRFLQQMCGNRLARRTARQAILHRSFRRKQFAEYCDRKTKQWRKAGRISPERRFARLSPRFLTNAILAKLTPAGLQRWLSDPQQRRTQLARFVLLIASGRYQREYGRQMIRRSLREWTTAGRLPPREQASLEKQSDSHELDEYARCFGMHLSLKLIMPVLIPLKVGGLAAFAVTKDPWYLLPMAVSPIARTAITLWRMARNRWRGVRYGEALAIGILPLVGSLAFPVQMYAAHKQLATFLIRDNAARLGRWIPIYGGRNSRLEIAAIKAADIPIELLDIGLSVIAWFRGLFPQWKSVQPEEVAPATLSASRWQRWVDHHIKKLIESEAAQQLINDHIDNLYKQQTHYRQPNHYRKAS